MFVGEESILQFNLKWFREEKKSVLLCTTELDMLQFIYMFPIVEH